jgi:hypothetical protein
MPDVRTTSAHFRRPGRGPLLLFRAGTVLLLLAGAACRQGEDLVTGRWISADTIAAHGAFSTHDHRVAALAMGGGGELHALFLDDKDGDGTSDRLLYAHYDGRSWGTPAVIEATAGATDAPRLAMDANGLLHVVWLEATDPAAPTRLTSVLHRMRANQDWSEAETIYRTDTLYSLPVVSSLATDGAGELHLLHANGRGGGVHRAYQGGRWSIVAELPVLDGGSPVLVPSPAGGLAEAEIAPISNPFLGGASFGNAMVRAYHDGRWSLAVPVHPDPGQHSHSPQLAFDRSGTMHMIWMQGAGGEMLPTKLLHATSRNSGATWTDPVDLAEGVPGGTLYSPRVLLDGRGVLHVTFARFQGELTNPRHFHRMLHAGAWTPAAEISPRGQPDSELETTVDSHGRVHALWKDGGTYRHAYMVTWSAGAHALGDR